jgi:periplasmic divalent cation tolerance protein
MKDGFIQVITTVDQKEVAEKIAQALIKNRLAACVQIIGSMTSIYRWEDNLEKTEEWLCLIKSKRSLFEKVEEKIKEVHPYKVPEIITLPIISGSEDYLEWLQNELKNNN